MEALLSFLLICLKQRQISAYYIFSIALVPRLDACEEIISFLGPRWLWAREDQNGRFQKVSLGIMKDQTGWFQQKNSLSIKLVNVGKRKGAAKANIVHEISNDLWKIQSLADWVRMELPTSSGILSSEKDFCCFVFNFSHCVHFVQHTA